MSLKKLRLSVGMTQQQLASKVDVSIKTISNIENGKPCQQLIAQRLATFFGTTIDDIIKKER